MAELSWWSHALSCCFWQRLCFCGGMSAPPTIAKPDSPLAQKVFPSPNCGERRAGAAPDCVVLHYTGMAAASEALLWLANPLAQVSCHYFVFEDGRIFQMVPERARAWHAGKSFWQGETDMNSRSIGIEIANPGHDLSRMPPQPGQYPDFPPGQIAAVTALAKDVVARWRMNPQRVLAHSDIAPGRKVDPGERFPWARLAEEGLGLWARDVPPAAAMPSYARGDEGMPVRALQALLARFGFGLPLSGVYDQNTEDAVSAFQRHWRQSKVDGIADGETIATLRALMAAAV